MPTDNEHNLWGDYIALVQVLTRPTPPEGEPPPTPATTAATYMLLGWGEAAEAADSRGVSPHLRGPRHSGV